MEQMNNNRPNILFILSDDQGAWALGSAGNAEIQTPNLDRLAEEGIRFDNFFCASPVCSPARASIVTGRIPSQHGVHDWIRGGNINDPEAHYHWGEDHAIEYLAGMTGYPELLAAKGYQCAISGKWHLGAQETVQQGFDYWYVHAFGGGSYYSYPMIRDGQIVDKTTYVTDEITDGALRFLDQYRDADRPFYLSVHYTAPHSPWTASEHPDEYLDIYRDCPFESTPDLPLHPNQIKTTAKGDTPENRRTCLTGYYASITAMDAQIGRIFERLKDIGEYDNTIIIFTSDNGMNMGHHGVWGKGNGTFPLNMYESSVKIPFLIRMPGEENPGRVEEALVSHYDILPTFCELLDLPLPGPEPPLPGVSFLSLLRSKPGPTREEVILFDEYGPARMIRTPTDKYVHRYPYGPHEYYDLETDPDETANLLETDPDAVQERIAFLRGRLLRWYEEHVSPTMDGSRLPVTGSGQLASITEMLQGAEGFGSRLEV